MDVRLLTAENLSSEYRQMGFEVSTVFRRTRHLPIDYFRLIARILRRRPQFVLLQSWIKSPLVESQLLPLLSARGIKVAITIHDLLPHHPRLWSRYELERYYQAAAGLIVHSTRTATELAAWGIFKPVLQVPHGIYDVFDVEHLDRRTARARLGGLNEDDFVVLFFGHLDRRKGLFEFIEAANMFRSDPTVRFVVAGRSSLNASESSLLDLGARSAGVRVDDRRIPFHEVQSYFAAADVVALPYLEGTTSGVLKLALAFGKPVIATAVGDLAETVGTDLGLLIQPHDVAKNLAAAIHAIRPRRTEFEEKVKALRDLYSWKIIATKYARFFDELMAARSERECGG